jgi:hypothetical protein
MGLKKGLHSTDKQIGRFGKRRFHIKDIPHVFNLEVLFRAFGKSLCT